MVIRTIWDNENYELTNNGWYSVSVGDVIDYDSIDAAALNKFAGIDYDNINYKDIDIDNIINDGCFVIIND